MHCPHLLKYSFHILSFNRAAVPPFPRCMCVRPLAAVGASLLPALRIRAAYLATCSSRAVRGACPLSSGGGGTRRQRRAMAAAAGTLPADAAAASTAHGDADTNPRAEQLLRTLAIPPPPDYELFKGSWVEHVLAPRQGLLSEIVSEALRLPEVSAWGRGCKTGGSFLGCHTCENGGASRTACNRQAVALLSSYRCVDSGLQCRSAAATQRCQQLSAVALLLGTQSSITTLPRRVRSSCCCALARCTPAQCPLLSRPLCWQRCLPLRWRRRGRGGRRPSRWQATA